MNLREQFTNNSWWGKLVGAFLGFLMAGPVGAMFGIFIGNFFDRGLVEHFSSPYWDYQNERDPTTRAIFIDATYSLLGYITKSDGRVSELEISAVRTLMNDMKLKNSERETAKKCFSNGKNAQFNPRTTLEMLSQIIQKKQNLKRLLINILYQIANVDGLTSEKITAFNIILQYFNMAPLHNQYERHYHYSYTTSNSQNSQNSQQTYRYPGTLDAAYDILRVSSEATQSDVKRAYRRLISKNHPDKMIAKGLSEQTIKMANEKTQQIRKAYEQICASKGW